MTTTTQPLPRRRSTKLDRAIVASIAAMSVFVLSQQLHQAPAFAAIDSPTGQRA